MVLEYKINWKNISRISLNFSFTFLFLLSHHSNKFLFILIPLFFSLTNISSNPHKKEISPSHDRHLMINLVLWRVRGSHDDMIVGENLLKNLTISPSPISFFRHLTSTHLNNSISPSLFTSTTKTNILTPSSYISQGYKI